MPDEVQRDYYVPTFYLSIDGKKLDYEVARDITKVTYEDKLNAADIFSFTLRVRHEKPEYFHADKLTMIDSELFKEGGVAEIKIGYHNDLHTMIVGEITALEPVFPQDEIPTLTVRGQSRYHRLRREKKRRPFIDMSDGQIAEQIAREMNLTPDIDRTDRKYPYVYQNNQNNIDFLKERAARINYEVWVTDRTLHFKKSGSGQEKIHTLEWGKTLRSFSPRLNTLNQLSKVIVKGYTLKEEEIIGIAKKGDEISKMGGTKTGPQAVEEAYDLETKAAVVDRPIRSQLEAEEMAKAKYNKIALDYITGSGTCIGTPEIRTGRVVELRGLGRRFSGLYYITSSTHTMNDSGYLTRFEVKRSAT
jgi:phage protein D